MEGGSTNAITWASGKRRTTWRLTPIAKDMSRLCMGRDISFRHVSQSANAVADFLSKMGMDCLEGCVSYL